MDEINFRLVIWEWVQCSSGDGEEHQVPTLPGQKQQIARLKTRIWSPALLAGSKPILRSIPPATQSSGYVLKVAAVLVVMEDTSLHSRNWRLTHPRPVTPH